jgi:hypothetical protein
LENLEIDILNRSLVDKNQKERVSIWQFDENEYLNELRNEQKILDIYSEENKPTSHANKRDADEYVKITINEDKTYYIGSSYLEESSLYKSVTNENGSIQTVETNNALANDLNTKDAVVPENVQDSSQSISSQSAILLNSNSSGIRESTLSPTTVAPTSEHKKPEKVKKSKKSAKEEPRICQKNQMSSNNNQQITSLKQTACQKNSRKKLYRQLVKQIYPQKLKPTL